MGRRSCVYLGLRLRSRGRFVGLNSCLVQVAVLIAMPARDDSRAPDKDQLLGDYALGVAECAWDGGKM